MAKAPKMRPDFNETAFRIMQAATGEGPKPEPPGSGEKNPDAVKRGRQGGKKGGKARALKLSADERKRIARSGSRARWNRKKD